jgi:hypothetical protein
VTVDAEQEEILRTGAFMVTLLPRKWWESGMRDDTAWPYHEHVLRPLLEASSEAWVYSTKPKSRAELAAEGLLARSKGKFRILSNGNPVEGRECFWNATSGDRGSVVFVLPVDRFPGEAVFPHCWDPGVLGNFTAAHTPSAVRYARAKVSEGDQIVCMLSRNNGFQWLFVLASPQKLIELSELAQRVCKSQSAT